MQEVQEFLSEKEIKNKTNKKLVVLMIYKENCPLCDQAYSWIDEFSKEFPNTKFAIINEKNLNQRDSCISPIGFPTFAVIKNNEILDTFYGKIKYDLVKKFITTSAI